MLTLLRVS